MARFEYQLPERIDPLFPHGPPLTPENFLALLGPTLEIEVGAMDSLEPPRRGIALIDTGSAFTAVDGTVCEELGLAPTQVKSVIHTGGSGKRYCYSLQIGLPTLGIQPMFDPYVISVDLAGGGQPYIALIGRDVLRKLRLIYDGPQGRYVIEYDESDPPSVLQSGYSGQ